VSIPSLFALLRGGFRAAIPSHLNVQAIGLVSLFAHLARNEAKEPNGRPRVIKAVCRHPLPLVRGRSNIGRGAASQPTPVFLRPPLPEQSPPENVEGRTFPALFQLKKTEAKSHGAAQTGRKKRNNHAEKSRFYRPPPARRAPPHIAPPSAILAQ
jgi:hypothetical protein